MTINVISDLHCGYDREHKTVCWNRNVFKDTLTGEFYNEETVKKLDENNAINFLMEYKSQLYKNKKEICGFKPNDVTFDKWYPIKHKIRNYEDAEKGLNRVIKYMYTDHYKQCDVMNDLCRGIQNFCQQACKKYYFPTMERVFRCLWRRQQEFVPEKLQPADYLIVAGDLGLDDSYKIVYDELKERTKNLFKDVFFIKGNHDYWCFDHTKTDMNLEDRFFERTIGNYVFLGCTMWAPVRVGTWEERCCVRSMNDYRYIPKYNVHRVNKLYKEESEWLRTKTLANKDKKVIIFTHHNPYPELIDDDYKHSDVNAAYAVLDGSVNDIKPSLWICGHSHSTKDIVVNGVRVVRNPIGYREHYGYLPTEVNPIHWYDTVIEI